MNYKKILSILKWLWFIVVIGVAGWYLFTNFSEIQSILDDIQIYKLISSFFLLCISKFLTADLTYQSLKINGQNFSFKDAFSITTITQLGKYLPGGIWHFAGKFGVYKSRGISSKDAIKPMIIENIWLIASAIITGLSAILFSQSELPCQFIPLLCNRVNILIGLMMLIFLWTICTYIIERYILNTSISMLTHIRIGVEQIIIWLLFGISFWIIFPSNINQGFFPAAISAFSLSWVAGYAAFFAPGGIGIRETALTFLLTEYLAPETTTILASVHRLLWVITEIILAIFTMAILGLPLGLSHQRNTKPGQTKNNDI